MGYRSMELLELIVAMMDLKATGDDVEHVSAAIYIICQYQDRVGS